VTGEPSPISLDELTRRLAEIDALLDGEARDPGAVQYALLNERDGLRALAARYRAGKDAGRSITELKSEMEALQRHRKSLLASRTGYVTGKGGNNHGAVSAAWVKLAAQGRGTGDFDRIDTRVTEIQDELRKRRSDQ
jgi:hypothetical protein